MTKIDMVPVTLNGRWPLKLPAHRAARPEWTTGWEVERLDSMWRNIEKGMHVVDVGAEEGDISALCATWVGDTGHVTLVEPNPKVWPNIRVIWAANRLKHPSWFVGFAGDVNDLTPARLNYWDRDIAGWPECAWGPVIGDHGFRHYYQERDATRTVTLDRLCDGRPVDAITIDVEGAELAVLEGARRILWNDRPLVWVSIHEAFLRDMYDTSPTAIFDYMGELRYQATFLATDHEDHWLFAPRDRAAPTR